MGNTIVLGMQWGDEAKGKLVDILAEEHKVVVRYQGGCNAGHTIVIGDKEEQNKTLAVRNDGKIKSEKKENFLTSLKKEIQERR